MFASYSNNQKLINGSYMNFETIKSTVFKNPAKSIALTFILGFAGGAITERYLIATSIIYSCSNVTSGGITSCYKYGYDTVLKKIVSTQKVLNTQCPIKPATNNCP